ncbi:hypothetical protein RND81_03G042800 [Saponaria officinalis]|uniref:Secreted protein n=1 Tax=Saponaria officinalis TaxID=3572 RepID=A0AAW1M4K3_SAPOF
MKMTKLAIIPCIVFLQTVFLQKKFSSDNLVQYHFIITIDVFKSRRRQNSTNEEGRRTVAIEVAPFDALLFKIFIGNRDLNSFESVSNNKREMTCFRSFWMS